MITKPQPLYNKIIWFLYKKGVPIKYLSFIQPKLRKIPKETLYCYTIKKFEMEKDGPVLHTDVCPFWGSDESREDMDSGYCKLTGFHDWNEEGYGLLWDQCKECHIDDDLPEHELDYSEAKYREIKKNGSI